MRHTIIEELTIPASDLANYVGWTLNGAMSKHGTLAWGKILAATPVGRTVTVTYERTVRGQTVTDTVILSTVRPDFATGGHAPHMVTVSRAA